MLFLLLSLLTLTISGLLILFSCRSRKISAYLFLWSLIAACGFGICSAISVLGQKVIVLLPSTGVYFRVHGQLPLGEFYIGIDPLSAFFLLLLFIVSLAAGIYGYGYLRDYVGKRNVGVHFALYHLLIIVMVLVLVAKNAVLFLAAWELMTVVSYFLIIFYNETESVRSAGFIYLIAAHLGTFCLALMFLIMGTHSGSMNFDQMTLTRFPLDLAGLLFVLAFLGFGIKSGFIPFHIWLPRAHPAAPSYISALLSGVLIKMGIYGLMRMIVIVKDFPLWCGVMLLIMAVISAVGGVLYALAQGEIKKLLAYSSIENIGIVGLGLSVGMIGHAYHQETVAFIGYTAALIHAFNHAIFKGLLFLSAGSVIRSTHSGGMERMGGLLKWLPWTGNLFLIGSLSICGFPLFNGFIGEWLTFRALLEGVFHLDIFGIIFFSLSIVALSLVGGLAAFTFAKAFGVIFLGKNRASQAFEYREGDLILCGPMAFLAAICLWAGLFSITMVNFAFQATQIVAGIPVPNALRAGIIGPLLLGTKVLCGGGIIVALFVLLRRILTSGYIARTAETWMCGYAYVTNRMQYTDSSFAKPMLKIFRSIILFKIDTFRPKGYFPMVTKLCSSVKDASQDMLFRPLYYLIKRFSRKLKWIQSGHTQTYILYILFLLVVFLIWKLS